jgi:hypothetical protein
MDPSDFKINEVLRHEGLWRLEVFLPSARQNVL